MAPEYAYSGLDRKFSQAESYETLAQKHGAMEADKQASRDALDNKTIEIKSGETLGKKLLDAFGGNTAKSRKLMFSMLAQLSRAGFNVDYVKAGEKFQFLNNLIKITDPNGIETTVNLDESQEKILINTCRRTIETSREMAANIALDIYNLYLVGKAGAGIENWEKEKGVFIEAIVVLLSDNKVVEADFYKTHYQKLHQNVAKMEAEHGKGSAEHNLAVVELLKKVRDVVKTDPNGMKKLWTYVSAYMGASEEDRQAIKGERLTTSPGSYSIEATTPAPTAATDAPNGEAEAATTSAGETADEDTPRWLKRGKMPLTLWKKVEEFLSNGYKSGEIVYRKQKLELYLNDHNVLYLKQKGGDQWYKLGKSESERYALPDLENPILHDAMHEANDVFLQAVNKELKQNSFLTENGYKHSKTTTIVIQKNGAWTQAKVSTIFVYKDSTNQNQQVLIKKIYTMNGQVKDGVTLDPKQVADELVEELKVSIEKGLTVEE